jgi:hypothetical protein
VSRASFESTTTLVAYGDVLRFSIIALQLARLRAMGMEQPTADKLESLAIDGNNG